jgi:hypothetical protein
VPVDTFNDLAAFDGSVLVDRTKGEISARCEGQEASLLALKAGEWHRSQHEKRYP